MSDLAGKLETPQTSGGRLAMAKLKQLRQRWGVEPTEWRKAELIRVCAMGEMETWRKCGGIGDDADFELIERRKVE